MPRRDVPARPGGASSRSLQSFSADDHKSAPTWRSNLSRIDYLGSSMLVLAIGTLLLGLSLKTSSIKATGEDYRWSDPLIWGLLSVAAATTIIFVLIEGLYSPEPILPLNLLTRRTPVAIALSSFTMVINQFSILYNIPLYFSAVRLTSASVAGAHVLPYSFMIGVGSLTIGWIMRRTGKYWWTNVISASIIVVSSILLLFWNVISPAWITWIAQIPAGFGYAGVLTSSLVALMTHVTRQGKGETLAVIDISSLYMLICFP